MKFTELLLRGPLWIALLGVLPPSGTQSGLMQPNGVPSCPPLGPVGPRHNRKPLLMVAARPRHPSIESRDALAYPQLLPRPV